MAAEPNADIVVQFDRLVIEVPYQSIPLHEAEELLARLQLAVDDLRSCGNGRGTE